jgi:hypothetical protein
MKDQENRPHFQIWTLVVGAIMSVIAGALSALLTHHLAQSSWSTNIEYEERAAVFQKRLELIERTSQLAGRAPGMQDVWQLYLKEAIAVSKRDKLPTVDPALSEKLADYNGQFRAVLELDALFFGPKTRADLASLKGTKGSLPYWEFPQENMHRLLSTMASELQAPPVGQADDGPTR